MTVSAQIDNPGGDSPLWKEYLELCKPKVVLLILFKQAFFSLPYA